MGALNYNRINKLGNGEVIFDSRNCLLHNLKAILRQAFPDDDDDEVGGSEWRYFSRLNAIEWCSYTEIIDKEKNLPVVDWRYFYEEDIPEFKHSELVIYHGEKFSYIGDHPLKEGFGVIAKVDATALTYVVEKGRIGKRKVLELTLAEIAEKYEVDEIIIK